MSGYTVPDLFVLGLVDSLFGECYAREIPEPEWRGAPVLAEHRWVVCTFRTERPETVRLVLTREGRRELELWRQRGKPLA